MTTQTSKQFHRVEIGAIYTRPSIGNQVVYQKVSNETDKKAGSSIIIDDINDASSIGHTCTPNRNHVVVIHDVNPITDECRKNAANAKIARKGNRRGLRKQAPQIEGWSKAKEIELGPDGAPYQVAINGEVLTVTRRNARLMVASGLCISADSVRFNGSSSVPSVYSQAKLQKAS